MTSHAMTKADGSPVFPHTTPGFAEQQRSAWVLRSWSG
eukprot:CAMPEP_0172891174 /NCGR_PEP_ID=MMETSP1075-20121228/143186_1 /TAXON_ID=2916 /ORGANISM="Ceratium fusus, Strain PA161109" /LENGTH=37 /DNA_ID= /DNA_START= /DNA_END= /DNA_ORIENTATION=